MQEIGIESSLVKAIYSGIKTIEVRLGKPRFLKMKVGDILSIREDIWEDDKIVDNIEDVLHIKITQILYFESFDEMLESIDFESVIPYAKNITEAKQLFSKFYTKEAEEEYGIMAFYFELV